MSKSEVFHKITYEETEEGDYGKSCRSWFQVEHFLYAPPWYRLWFWKVPAGFVMFSWANMRVFMWFWTGRFAWNCCHFQEHGLIVHFGTFLSFLLIYYFPALVFLFISWSFLTAIVLSLNWRKPYLFALSSQSTISDTHALFPWVFYPNQSRPHMW